MALIAFQFIGAIMEAPLGQKCVKLEIIGRKYLLNLSFFLEIYFFDCYCFLNLVNGNTNSYNTSQPHT